MNSEEKREVKELAPREKILGDIRLASQALSAAHMAGVAANPMCADVQCFRRLNEMAKELNVLMQEVGKLRGL